MYLKSVSKRLTYVYLLKFILLFFFFVLQQKFAKSQFALQTVGTAVEDSWNDVIVDDDGNVYVVGNYKSQTEVSQLIPSIINSSPANGKDQLMVAKFDSLENLIWFAYGKLPCAFYGTGQTTGKLITLDQESGLVYISGDQAGMHVTGVNISNGTSWDFGPQEEVQGLCPGDDNIMQSYIMKFNMINGSYGGWYNQYRGPIDAMVLDNYGIHSGDLYVSMNTEYATPQHVSFINRIENSSLWPTDIINTGSLFIHSINDLYYKENKIYLVGTTEGPLSFNSGPSLNFNSTTQQSVAWVGLVTNTNLMQVQNLQYGGLGVSGNTNQVTGEQISMDLDGNLIIAGLFTEELVIPFSSGVARFSSNPAGRSGYIIRLNSNTLNLFDAIHTMESDPPFEVSAIEMNSKKYDVYVSLTYAGRVLKFFPSTNDDIDLNTSSPVPNNNEKVAIINYEETPTLVKLRHNTTSGFVPSDRHFSKANAIGFHHVHTVGNFSGEMHFDAIMNSLNVPLNTGSVIKGGFVIRNDYDWANGNGTFKNYDDDSKDEFKSVDISIYPNPNNGAFYIDGINKNDIIELFDTLGRKLKFSVEYSYNGVFIVLENQSAMCIVKINNESHIVNTK